MSEESVIQQLNEAVESLYKQVKIIDEYINQLHSFSYSTVSNLRILENICKTIILKLSVEDFALWPEAELHDLIKYLKQIHEVLIADKTSSIDIVLSKSMDIVERVQGILLDADSPSHSRSRDTNLLELNVASLQSSIIELKERLSIISTDVNQQKARFDQIINDSQQEFNKLEFTRKAQFVELLSGLEKEGHTQINVYTRNFEKAKTDLESSYDNAYKEIQLYFEKFDTLQKRAEDIVTLISNTGLVGGYQQMANSDRKDKKFWRGVTACSMAGLIIFAFYAFWVTTHTDFKWGVFAARIFVAFSFGVFAAYAARIAERHQESERKHRQMELELATIDNYIVSLPEQTRNELKQKLADRMFAQHDLAKATETNAPSMPNTDVLKAVLENLKTIVEQLGKK